MAYKNSTVTPAQALRDLEWVLASPSLVTDPLAVDAIPFSASNASDEVREQVAKFCKRQVEHKVGRYYENLVGFWLEHVRGVEIVGKGIQVREEKRTVGEIDFLYRDENRQLVHLEAAVKFFLHFPNPTGSHFPGPNATDNFERKSEKLFTSQLAIGAAYYPEVQHRQAFMRGIIFYHPGNQVPSEFPLRMSKSHTKGVWIRESELDCLDRWFGGAIAPKPFWLSPISTTPIPIDKLKEELTVHFSGAGFPLMVGLTDTNGKPIDSRLFVVPDTWPN